MALTHPSPSSATSASRPTARPAISWRIARELYAFRAAEANSNQALGPVPTFLAEGLADAQGAYDAVEFGLSVLSSPQRAQAVGGALERSGLSAAAVFTTVKTDADQASLERIAEQAARAATLGCRMLTLATIPPERTAGPNPDAARTSEVCAALASRLQTCGVKVCWHPHQEHMIDDASGLSDVLDRTQGAGVDICLDLGWAHYLGFDPVRLAGICGNRLAGCHVRDSQDRIWRQALGEGNLDLRRIVAAATRSAALAWISVELWFERATPVSRSLRDNALFSAEVLRRAAAADLATSRPPVAALN